MGRKPKYATEEERAAAKLIQCNEAAKRHYARNVEKKREYHNKYYAENKDALLAIAKEKRAANPKKLGRPRKIINTLQVPATGGVSRVKNVVEIMAQ